MTCYQALRPCLPFLTSLLFSSIMWDERRNRVTWERAASGLAVDFTLPLFGSLPQPVVRDERQSLKDSACPGRAWSRASPLAYPHCFDKYVEAVGRSRLPLRVAFRRLARQPRGGWDLQCLWSNILMPHIAHEFQLRIQLCLTLPN